MGLFLTTTGGNVVIAELGITITHPTTDYEISAQFEPEEIRDAESLTTSIVNGTLEWRKTSGGGAETPADYDPDYLDIEREHTGTGEESDRSAIIGDLVNVEYEGTPVASNVRTIDFFGDMVVADEGGNKTSVKDPPVQGRRLFGLFSSTANSVNNKFLDTENIAASDILPAVAPVSDTVEKITFINVNDDATGTIEFRKNTTVGTPALSVVLPGDSEKAVFSVSLVVAEGDTFNCKVVSASNVGKPLVKLYI